MTNAIVQVSVSQTIAPTPSKLQRTGAFISQGGTTQTPGSYSLLTQASSLAAILTQPQTLASLTWATSVVTGTSSVPHGYPVGSVIALTIANAVPSGYNGTFQCTITSNTQFTYALVGNPGTETSPGTVIVFNTTVLQQMNTTFYAQNGQLAVYVLELGVGTSTAGIAYLTTWLVNNPGIFYALLVPRGWDADATYLPLLGAYESPSAKLYFYTTVTLSTYTNITALYKDAPMMIEAPGIPTGVNGEFSMASMFWVGLNANPSSANQVPPMTFSFVFDVTPYPLSGPSNNYVTIFKNANVNYITTGAEGGISNTILEWGVTPDGNPWNYWYSADWSQINLDLNIANTLINGSNTSINPLYYNQNGINTLQASAGNTMQQAISFGLALGQLITTQLDPTTFANNVSNGTYLGQVVVNAVPFATWVTQNPLTYAQGIYGGISVLYTPARGFEQILVNLNVSTFA
jgi:hypothetical protein